MPALHIRNLTIGHSNGNGLSYQENDDHYQGALIHKLNFTLLKGQILWVSGENGIGKTTLLRTIAQLHRPWAGQLIWGEASNTSEIEAVISHYLGPRDGFHAARKLKDELRFQTDLLSGTAHDLMRAIETLGLENLLDLPVAHLSSGQRQRAAFARVLACQRPLWLFDEPLTALDTHRRSLIISLIKSHIASGGMAIITGHDDLETAFDTPLNKLKLNRNPEAWQWVGQGNEQERANGGL